MRSPRPHPRPDVNASALGTAPTGRAQFYSPFSSPPASRASPFLVLLDVQHVRAEGHVVQPVGELAQSRRDDDTCHYVNHVVGVPLFRVRRVLRACIIQAEHKRARDVERNRASIKK